MSIKFKKVIEFSHYVDKANIRIFSKKSANLKMPKHRFSIFIPFNNRDTGPVATVIMFNPSKAGLKDDNGKIISDFTVYNVLQYLYHHKDTFKAVRILNLISSYSSNPTRLKPYKLNNINKRVLENRIKKINHERGDKLILAWGELPKSTPTEIKRIYKKQIEYIKSAIKDKLVYHVEDPYRQSHTPQHGSRWADYEKIVPYYFKQ